MKFRISHFNYIYIYFVLYLFSGYSTRVWDGTVILAISTLLSVILLLINLSRGVKSTHNNLLPIGLIVIIILTTYIFNEDQLKNLMIVLIVIVNAYICTIFISRNDFDRKFVDIMYILAIVSILTFSISIVSPRLITLFPKTYYSPNSDVRNVLLSYVNLNFSPQRSMGIFWEPGAFQLFLTHALIVESFFNKKPRKRIIIILIIGILTTLSTLGFITLVLWFVYYSLHRSEKIIDTLVRVLPKMITVLTLIFIIYLSLPTKLQFAYFGKITHFFQTNNGAVTSAYVRVTSITAPLISLRSSPIFGIGYDMLLTTTASYGHNMVTNTPVNILTMYGIPYGILIFIGIYKYIAVDRKFIKVLVFTLIVLNISTQELSRNLFLFIICFYGLSISNEGGSFL